MIVNNILAWGTKSFVAPGEHGFFFFQVKMFTGSVSVLLTSTSLKVIYIVTLAFNFLYPSFMLHVLEIENVTALCDSEKREPHIEQSVCLLQWIKFRIIRTRVSRPTLFVLNFDRG